MSAFIVSDETITAMLQIASYSDECYYWNEEHRLIGGRTTEIGQKLLDENYRAVNYKYSEDSEPHKYQHASIRHYEPVEIIVLCNCYRCRGDGTEDWEQSEAFAIWTALREKAIRKLPGYDAAAWGL